MTLVEQLAKAKKIADTYIDAWGNPAEVSQESKAAVLAAMGYDVENEDNLRKQVEKEEKELWTSPLDPVLVVREKKDLQLTVRLPIDLSNSELTCGIKVETGLRITSKIHAKIEKSLPRDHECRRVGSSFLGVILLRDLRISPSVRQSTPRRTGAP